jgi:hypothetical protein
MQLAHADTGPHRALHDGESNVLKKTLLFLLLALVGPSPGHATIIENYPDVDMAYVGPHVFNGPGGSTIAQPFRLRFTDPAGNPIPGLTVTFEPNRLVGIEGSMLPPISAYGSFSGLSFVSVLTDANGVATAPEFQIGTFVHDVLAGLWISTPENERVTQGGSGIAFFHINSPHWGPVDPQAPLGVAATALPIRSVTALIALTALSVMAGMVRLKSASRVRRVA